jgi:hypothetical protein
MPEARNGRTGPTRPDIRSPWPTQEASDQAPSGPRQQVLADADRRPSRRPSRRLQVLARGRRLAASATACGAAANTSS